MYYTSSIDVAARAHQVGEDAHVGVQLPHEAGEVVVLEVPRKYVRGQLRGAQHHERSALLGPAHDLIALGVLHQIPPARGRAQQRVSGGPGTLHFFEDNCATQACAIVQGAAARGRTFCAERARSSGTPCRQYAAPAAPPGPKSATRVTRTSSFGRLLTSEPTRADTPVLPSFPFRYRN